MTPEEAQAQADAQNQGLAAALEERNKLGLGPPPPAPTPTRGTFTGPGIPVSPQASAIARTSPQTLVDPATGLPPDPNTTRTDGNGNIFDKATGKMIMPVMAGARDLASPPIPGMPDEQHGGFAPGTYKVNPDGSILILAPQPSGRISVRAGDTVAVDGHVIGADGQPRVNHQLDQNGNVVPGGTDQQVWTPRQPDGKPATANPNFSGEGVLTNDDGSGLVDQIPGYKELKDLLAGVGGGGGGGAPIDTEAASDQVGRANDLADALEVDRQKAGAQADSDRGLGLQTREQQQAAIQQMQDAAAGKTPSVAELALTRQSGIDAARQQGLAAALQGNNPGAALRQASMGAAKIAGDTAANAAQLRAKEMTDNRVALANTLSGVRTQDQGAVNTDVTQQGNAQSGETTSNSTATTGAGNILNAQTEEDKAKAIEKGALISGGAALATGLLTKSDKRAKKDIAKTGLADALAKGVHGVTFEYVDPEDDREEGPQFGALAQELERVIPGAVKRRGGDGTRMVDTGHLSLANTGILAELAKRLIALEGKGGKRA